MWAVNSLRCLMMTLPGVQMTGRHLGSWEALWLVSGHTSSVSRGDYCVMMTSRPVITPPPSHNDTCLTAQWAPHETHTGLVTFCHAPQACRVKNINTVRMWQCLTSSHIRASLFFGQWEDWRVSLQPIRGCRVSPIKESSCHKYSKRKHTDSLIPDFPSFIKLRHRKQGNCFSGSPESESGWNIA